MVPCDYMRRQLRMSNKSSDLVLQLWHTSSQEASLSQENLLACGLVSECCFFAAACLATFFLDIT